MSRLIKQETLYMSNQVRAESRFRFVEIPKQLIAILGLSLAASITAQTASAQSGERSGKAVVEAVCSSCHRTGVNGAPKIGDKKAWAQLESRGLTGLTDIALKGIRKMPAHGGNQALSDSEIERAITYMVNQSGGHWTEPTSKRTPAAERSGKQIVQVQCTKCHQTGVDGAPKIGDRVAWIPRLKQGLEAAVLSAIKGHGPMPARGGMANLTDSEIRAAIVFMVNQGVAPAPGPSAALAAKPGSDHKVIEGTEIYLGIVSAESLRAEHPKEDAESLMHGGIPSGKGYYHVNISLLDSKTKAEITDAQVSVRITDPVMGGETKKLELMAVNNAISYGNYFRMPSKDPYTITVQIRKPGISRTIEAKFDFKNR
jgi:cytochrome c5